MILVVDDHEEIIEWMRITIQEAGYYCDSAIDATSAFYKIQNLEYALAIIDIGLPDYSGSTLAKLIRNLPNERRLLPLVAMTGADFIDTDKLFGAVLLKPVTLEQLHDAILKCAHPPIKDLHVTRKMWERQSL